MKKIIISMLILSLMVTLMGCEKQGQKDTINQGQASEAEKAGTFVDGDVVQIIAEDLDTEDVIETEVGPVVVAGTVSAARMLHGLGVALVAVPQTERYLPEALSALPTIGLPMNPDIELVKSHEPDYFITDASLEERLSDSMTEQSIETLFLNTSGFSNIMESIESLGALFNKNLEASLMVEAILADEAEALEIAKGHEPVSVAIIFGTPDSFMLATGMSYVGSMAMTLGAENITDTMQDARGPFVPFSLETLGEMDPDVILRMTHVSPEESLEMFETAFNDNPFYSALSAVKNNRVIDLDSHYFGVTATLDCGEAIILLAEHLYE